MPEPAPSRKNVSRRRTSGYLQQFRRSLRFVWPHRRYLFTSFVAALGVMIFYSSGISALLPILAVMMADHETLADGVYRHAACQRLGVQTIRDLPAETTRDVYLARIDTAPGDPLAATAVRGKDSIIAVNGKEGDCYELLRLIVNAPPETVLRIRPGSNRENATAPQEIHVALRPNPWYLPRLAAAANLADFGRSPAGRLKSLALVMSVFVAFSAVQLFCRFWQQYLVELTAARAMMDLRTQGYARILELPMSFFTQRRTGETMTRFATDTNVLLLGMRTLFGKTVREPLKAIGVLVLLVVFLGGKLLVIACLTALPAVYMIRKFGRIIRRSQRRALQAWDALLDLLQERISGIRVVKGYTMERAERLRFFREHRRLFKNQLRVQRFDVATSPILEFLATVVVGGFVLYGGSLVFREGANPAKFLQSVAFLIAMFDPIRKLSNVNNRLQQAEAAARRIFDIVDETPETATTDGRQRQSVALPRHNESIEFRGVSFSYPSRPDVRVLRDINLTIHVGETVAIVGPNGSGKTTLCHLLLRFYEPQAGTVRIDGRDLKTVDLGALRRQIGLVTQDTVIFTDTVAANIRYGQRHADPDRIRHAAETAHADEFIRDLESAPEASRNGQPPAKGYDAVIKSGTLSGGQKQRIAIARAVLRDPALLIFDEATSQIDPDSARKIHDALRRIRRNRTAILIAHHDREMLPEADRVIVMDKGRIVATGTHTELLKTCRLYQNLYETQFTTPNARPEVRAAEGPDAPPHAAT